MSSWWPCIFSLIVTHWHRLWLFLTSKEGATSKGQSPAGSSGAAEPSPDRMPTHDDRAEPTLEAEGAPPSGPGDHQDGQMAESDRHPGASASNATGEVKCPPETSDVPDWASLPLTVFTVLANSLSVGEAASARLVCPSWAQAAASCRRILRPVASPPDPQGWQVWKGLRTLDLPRCISSIDDAALEALQVLTGITSLNLTGCWKVTDAGMQSITGFRLLTALQLAGCEQITDDGIYAIANGATALEALDVSGCRNLRSNALVSLGRLCNLRRLSLRWCRRINDEGVRHLSRLQHLEALQLDEVKAVSDDGVAGLEHNTWLRTLSLMWCRSLTNKAVHELVLHHAGLTSLFLDGCKLVSDEGIVRLAAMPNLSVLHIACTEVSDTGLGSLGSLSGLRDLSLSNCQGVTELGLLVLPVGLEVLNLSRCGSVQGIKSLQRQKDLRSLNLLYCSALLASEVAGIRQSRPKMQVLFGSADV